MKTRFLATAVMTLGVWAGNAHALDLNALQEELHRRGDPWIAGSTSVSGLSLEEKRKLCGLVIPTAAEMLEYERKRAISSQNNSPRDRRRPVHVLAAEWDWRDHDGKNWMTPVKDQGYCGSCWAFATIGAFEACMKTFNDTPDENPNLSEQFLTSCDLTDFGCDGGSIHRPIDFFKATGIPEEDCFPYQDYNCSPGDNCTSPCSDRCSDWQQRVIKATSGDYIYPADVAAYKQRLMDGPLSCGIDMKEDFFYYVSGCYEPIMGEEKWSHGVVLCGWDGLKWLIKNSWGTGWGTGGYGWIMQLPELAGWMVPEEGASVPRVELNRSEITEPNDNFWDPGETVDIVVTLGNRGIDATNVTGVLSTTDPYVTVINATSGFGTIPASGTSNNSGNPYSASASAGAPDPHEVRFVLHVTADGGYSRDIDFCEYIGWKPGVVTDEFEAGGGIIPYGLAFDGVYLWATDYHESAIYKLDQSGVVVGQIPTPNSDTMCTGIDYDCVNDVLWVHDKMAKRIYKLNPSDGTILSDFATPASSYPTGLAFDGEHLWAADREAYKIYKLTTSGSVVTSFTVPVSPAPSYGPRGLAFEPMGPDEGSLILLMTHYTIGGDLDSTVVWEITRNGSLVPGHHFIAPGTNGRAIEVNPNTGKYWTSSWEPPMVYKVRGFYRPESGVEESRSKIGSLGLTVSPNPSRRMVTMGFYTQNVGDVSLDVYDISGKLICRLTDKAFAPGNHRVAWNGKDRSGKPVSPGVYFYRFKYKRLQQRGKFIIL